MRTEQKAREEREMKQRADERRKRIVGNVAENHEDADQWDLEFWQKQTPAMRLLTFDVARQHVRMMPGRNKMFDNELEADWAERGYREVFMEMGVAGIPWNTMQAGRRKGN